MFGHAIDHYCSCLGLEHTGTSNCARAAAACTGIDSDVSCCAGLIDNDALSGQAGDDLSAYLQVAADDYAFLRQDTTFAKQVPNKINHNNTEKSNSLLS